MQSKLTLRIDDTLVKKAKLLARKKGTSVSQLFSEYISTQSDESSSNQLPPITEAMIGAIRRQKVTINEEDYQRHLEEKYL